MAKAPKIEKGIPIPAVRTGTGITDLLRSLEVGDSVLLPIHMQHSISVLARNIGYTCVTRKLDARTIRVWRTA